MPHAGRQTPVRDARPRSLTPQFSRRGLALLLALATLLAAGTAAAQTLKLRYGQALSSLRSIYSLPIVVAQNEGLFRREGLDFQVVIPVPGGADRMIDALHEDTVDITHVATAFLIRAALNGSDAVAIAAEFNNPIYSLIARPEIREAAHLKGRMIGLADEAGSITIAARKLLARHGLAKGDFQFRTIDGTPSRYNCLLKGDCLAVPLGQPQDMLALSQGFRMIGTTDEVIPEFVYTVTAARRSWAAKNREALLRYLRALSASFTMIRDPARRNAVTAIIAKTYNVPEDVARRVLVLYFEPERNALPLRGEIDIKGFAAAITFMHEAGLLQPPLPEPGRFADLQYLRAAGILDAAR